MVGRSVEALYPRTPRRLGPVILEASDFGVAGANFALHRGEILGIAGLLGAGRTRLVRSIFGLESVRSGRVRVGTWSGPAAPHQRWQQGCGYVSEDRKEEGLAAGLSIADNMTLSRLEGLGPGPFIVPGTQDRAASRWSDRLQIKSRSPRQSVAELSGGNQQKVAIARLLHHDVDVLLLDEPTRGIDVASKAQIYELIDALVAERQPNGHQPRAVLMISSYVPELLGLCDRVAVMCRGRLGAPRPVAELNEHEIMLEATGTGDA
jgi:ribose transport system ATP-binding protein